MEESNSSKPQRLMILGDDEIDALFGLPRFTERQRIEFFSLSMQEQSVVEELRTIQSKAYFLLQLGYFKDRQMFFAFDPEEVQEDVQYILETHFPQCRLSHFTIARNTRARQQRLILEPRPVVCRAALFLPKNFITVSEFTEEYPSTPATPDP